MIKFKIVEDEVELYFDEKPSDETRTEMKALKIWWNPDKKCWYGRNSSEVLALAKRLCEKHADEQIEQVVKTSKIACARCCYYGSVENFLTEDKNDWIEKMKTTFSEMFTMPLGESQVRAWKDCFDVLKKELPNVNSDYPGLQIIFEYALPYESGRRPDVILLSKKQVIILEFKQYSNILQADIDQVKGYARDLKEYHFESREKDIVPVLLLTGTENLEPKPYDGITICSKSWIYELLKEKLTKPVSTCDAKSWMDSKYEPLPTIVESARNFMNNEELPNIKRVNSTCIPDAIDCLTNIAKDAKKNSKHVLAFVTGVPGAGKTYLGLQYVYDICKSNENVNSIYLSGNGSLIKVLQDALKSKVFVRGVHSVLNEYISGNMNSFEKNIVVFDEGQRAWDANQMNIKKHVNKSEPDIMVELCDRKLDWCVLLILVGEGQEIYNGENSGLSQWNTAIEKAMNNWDIVCPDKLENIFTLPVKTNSALDLSKSLRTHTAGEVGSFVNAFIDGDIKGASLKAKDIINSGFNMYYTRDLESAKKYCRDRYSNYDNYSYGMISSSMNKNLGKYGLSPKFQPNVAAWFNGKPSDPESSCALNVTISEFDCQGLEVDMPIIGWGDDIKWNGTKWIPSGNTQDDKAYRINSYRVLLTRGRDGFIVFIPPVDDMDIIEKVFKEAGVNKLSPVMDIL